MVGPYGPTSTMHTACDACSTTSRGVLAAGRSPGPRVAHELLLAHRGGHDTDHRPIHRRGDGSIRATPSGDTRTRSVKVPPTSTPSR